MDDEAIVETLMDIAEGLHRLAGAVERVLERIEDGELEGDGEGQEL